MPKISDLASELKQRLSDLNSAMSKLLLDKIVENFVDILGPVKSFVSTVRHSENGVYSDSKSLFDEKSRFLYDHVNKCVQTARLVSRAAAHSERCSQTCKKLNDCTNNVQDSIGHLINVGKLLYSRPTEKHVDELFRSVFQQFQQNFSSMRQCIDEIVEIKDFVKASGSAIEKCCDLCEMALLQKNMQIFVANTARIVKLCNRIVDKVDCDLENTDDHDYIDNVKNLVSQLQNGMLKSMQTAKRVVQKLTENDIFEWKDIAKEILGSIAQIQLYLLEHGKVPAPVSYTKAAQLEIKKPAQTCTFQRMKRCHSFNNGESASIRRSPSDAGYISDTSAGVARSLPEQQRQKFVSRSIFDVRDQYRRENRHRWNFDHERKLKSDSVVQNGKIISRHVTSPPRYSNSDGTQDNEDLQAIWERVSLPRQQNKIFDGARDLRDEISQWSSEHNDLVAAAVRVSLLMAKLSQLVWCEIGTKKELIACSKAIANASEEVTDIALRLAAFCPYLEIRKMLRQACEKVPTAATQLKILSTVKATMVDCPDRNEVEQAMRQLVFNAENLIKCVKNTVKVAETASLKIQHDTGLRLKWIRKSATREF